MIDSFRGKYAFLSNFYPSEISIPYRYLGGYENIVYPTVEHAFQAAKTTDIEWKLRIANASSPALAKRLGRKVPLDSEWTHYKRWNDRRQTVMKVFLVKKFMSIPELRTKLADTGDEELIEGNTWNDTYWGVCRGVGENHLGKLLMEVREML